MRAPLSFATSPLRSKDQSMSSYLLTSTSTASDPVQLRARIRRAMMVNVAFMSTLQSRSVDGEPVCLCLSGLLGVGFTTVYILLLFRSALHLCGHMTGGA